MPRKKKASPVAQVENLKTPVYNNPAEHAELVQDLNQENLALGLNPRDRRSDKAGKTLSDLYVTLGRIWRENAAVRELVRTFWGLDLGGRQSGKAGDQGKKRP